VAAEGFVADDLLAAVGQRDEPSGDVELVAEAAVALGLRRHAIDLQGEVQRATGHNAAGGGFPDAEAPVGTEGHGGDVDGGTAADRQFPPSGVERDEGLIEASVEDGRAGFFDVSDRGGRHRRGVRRTEDTDDTDDTDDTNGEDEGEEETVGAHAGRLPDRAPSVTDPAAADVGAC
jgi:hypothetical protein